MVTISKRVVKFILVFALLFEPFFYGHSIVYAQSNTNINPTTSSTATANSPQRKSFYDSINDRNWIFFNDGTKIATSFSSDNINWQSSNSISLDTDDFSLHYQNIDSQNYLYIVVPCADALCAYSGTLATDSVSFSAPSEIAQAGANEMIKSPSITISPTNYLIASWIKTNTEDNISNIMAAVSANTLDHNTWAIPQAVGQASSLLNTTTLSAGGDGKSYLIASNSAGNIASYAYDGLNWSEANEGGDNSMYEFYSGYRQVPQEIIQKDQKLYIANIDTGQTDFTQNDKIMLYDQSNRTWEHLGTGIDDPGTIVSALGQYDDYIIVGGHFSGAGGVENTNTIALWDTVGEQWIALGTGLPYFEIVAYPMQRISSVSSIVSYGDSIYASGEFTNFSSPKNENSILRRWDFSDQQWHTVLDAATTQSIGWITEMIVRGDTLFLFDGDGKIYTMNLIDETVSTFATASGGSMQDFLISGDSLYAGGAFTSINDLPNTGYLAEYNFISQQWQQLGENISSVSSLSKEGDDLYINGYNNVLGQPCFLINLNTQSDAWECLIDSYQSMSRTFHIGGELLIAGNLFLIEDAEGNPLLSSRLVRYGPATAKNVSSSDRFSVLSQGGAIHLLYLDQGGKLIYKKRDAQWRESVTLSNSSSTNPSLSYEPGDNKIYAFWQEDGKILFKSALSPFEVDDWSGVQTINNQSNNYFVTTPETFKAQNIIAFWTQGSGGSFFITEYAFGSPETLDNTSPTGTIAINANANYTCLANVTLRISAADDQSGVSQMRFSSNNINWGNWENYAVTKSWTLTNTLGIKTVYAQFKDTAGNSSATASDSISIDNIPPSGSALVNNNSPYTRTSTVTLNLKAADTGGSGLSSMRFSNNGKLWTTWQSYSTKKTWNLTSGYGAINSEAAKKVYVQFRDNAGCLIARNDTITYDKTAPSGRIKIKNGAYRTYSRYVTLYVSATDQPAGVGYARISNNGKKWTSWRKYSTRYRRWNITSSKYGGTWRRGKKYVYIQFKDKAGNISVRKRDYIMW